MLLTTAANGKATGWQNAEFRSYQFVDPTGQDADAFLRETSESWKRREGETTQPTETEQKELRTAYYNDAGQNLKYKPH
jgi:hypothetical protein